VQSGIPGALKLASDNRPQLELVRNEIDRVGRCRRKAAETMPPWFCLAMDMAVVCGQRREDLTQMRFSHVVNGRLLVEQGKTGAMISLPLDLELKIVGLRLGTVIDRCRLVSTTDFMISADIRKNSPDGSIHPGGLTEKFVAARKASGLSFEKSPPTFHEIRSLAGRLYEKERGKEGKRERFCAKTAGAYNGNDHAEIS